MKKTPITELPSYWQKQIKDLRAESARYRCEARELRAELEALRESVGQ